MIFLNKEEKTAQEVADMFGIPLAKIVKAAEFEINPNKIKVKKFGQSKEMSLPAGTAVPSVFYAKYQGKNLEVQYAETNQRVKVGDKMEDDYYPKKVRYEGESMLLDSENEDLLVFFWLHPFQETSPFRSQVKRAFLWSFKDMEARGKAAMAKISELTSALNFVQALRGEKLRVVAKGLNIAGVDQMQDFAVQAELAKKAQEDPAGFNVSVQKQHTMFRGLVVNAIDKGVFRLDNSHGSRTWVWGRGVNGEAEIIPVLSQTSDPNKILIDHVMGNVNEFYSKMLDANATLNATKKAEEVLDGSGLDLDKLLDSSPKSTAGVPDIQSEFGGGTGESSSEDVEPDPTEGMTAEQEMAYFTARHKEIFGVAKPPTIKLENLREKVKAREKELADAQS